MARNSDLTGQNGWGGFMTVCISRHGNRPNRIPKDHRLAELLPGAINVSFLDGHAESVRLECLWQLYWHKDYPPPTKRPGLP